MKGPTTTTKVAVAVLGVALFAAGCGSSTSTTSSSSNSKVTMALMAPLSGSFAYVGQWLVHGAAVATYEVNSNGGVLGHKLTTVEADTAGDPVDAVPAWNRLASEKPAFEIGPTALTIESVIQKYDSAQLPDFTIAGTTELDNMNYKYVFRTGPSDSTLAKAMAAYAIHQHLTKALLIFANGVSSQTLVAPLTSGYQAHGGTITDKLILTPDQSSYLSELTQAFATHPDAVFMQLGPNTSATVFHDMQELGDLNIPIIDTDNGTNVAVAKAMGLTTASKLLTGMTATAPSGPAFKSFLAAYKHVYHTSTYLPLTPDEYDGVIIAALAMTAANSTNPSVWINKVVSVSNPPGTACYTYSSCVADLKAGKQINYQGASGPEDFNKYHNTFSGWTVVKWTTSGTLTPVYTVQPNVIANY